MSLVRVPVVLLVTLAALSFGNARTFDRCELARELWHRFGLGDQVPTWVCIAYHESRFDTGAIGPPNSDGSRDHGIFQINDRYWCSPPGHGCGVSCDAVRSDDISTSVDCVRKVHEEWQRIHGNGFAAWSVYHNCNSPDKVQRFVDGC